jgi:putative long chain acyl-CoA synthase
MDLTPRGVARRAARVGAAAQNALEIARFGGLDTGEEPAPFDVVVEHPVYRLRRYPSTGSSSDVVLVPPLMLAADVYDVSPATSAVRILAASGVTAWVVDFGAPEHEEGGLSRTLTDHVVAVSDVVTRVGEMTGRGVHLGGYSQGGMFCYQAAAYRRGEGIDRLITFGSPVDTQGMIPFGLPQEPLTKAASFLAEHVIPGQPLPAWASRIGFRLLDPVKAVRQRFDFLRQLHDREQLLPRERQRRFLEAEGWVAWPGPAIAELLDQFVAHNRMLSGGFVIEDRLVTLADIALPVLCFVGEVDEIAPAPNVRSIMRAAPKAEVYETPLHAGHFGLVVGSTAAETTWPTVADWVLWRDGSGTKPAAIAPMQVDEPAEGPGVHVSYGVELAGQVATGMARSTAAAFSRTARTALAFADQAAQQLPRLARLEAVRPNTRVSLGRLLDEQARRAPDATFFLFEDRGHTYAAAKRRIDAIVRGLLSVGIRQGEHVGVLMGTRPSAIAVVAALNRLGAVAVLLRPDGALTREVELGQVGRVIADPEHADGARAALEVPVLVLGGGGEPRELGFGLTDMERIDPDQVPLPAWYRPNPGRAQDLAFILFTGNGEHTRFNRITNSRWALSAFGTASAAALDAGDTVYCIAPIHHAAGLLTSVGGAVAGGSRLALASKFDPGTFWDEVRRYGVTIVSYTWALVRELLDAPVQAGERHHPVRLFVGSGMPKGLWRRTLQRFAPAGVVEFYASTEGEAVLANLGGGKVGSKGRPLLGSAPVRLAAYDVDARRLVEGPDGMAVPCRRGEVGILLSKVDPAHLPAAGNPLRGLFAVDDAWLPTNDLFRRDTDGDFWMVDHLPALIRTARGMVATMPIEDALGDVDAVDLATVYGVPCGDVEVVVAAVMVRRGMDLSADALTHALSVLPVAERPDVVRVVPEIPLTTWYRPINASLRKEGVADAVWTLDATG